MRPRARTALDPYRLESRLPATPGRWAPKTLVLASLDEDAGTAVTGARLWTVRQRFFAQAAAIGWSDPPLCPSSTRSGPTQPRRGECRLQGVGVIVFFDSVTNQTSTPPPSTTMVCPVA